MKSVEITTDGEPSIVEIARWAQARRNNDSGTNERWRSPRNWSCGTCEWNSAGAVALPGRARSNESENHSGYTVVSMDVAAFCLTIVRNQSDQRTKQTPYERTRGCRYESALVPLGEVVMAKSADADKIRAGRLDSAWVKAVWVGREDRSNEHLLLTTKGCFRSRVVRRIPDGNQASYHAE